VRLPRPAGDVEGSQEAHRPDGGLDLLEVGIDGAARVAVVGPDLQHGHQDPGTVQVVAALQSHGSILGAWQGEPVAQLLAWVASWGSRAAHGPA
jgi:hypothetical protein